jgi:hypothetical protein
MVELQAQGQINNGLIGDLSSQIRLALTEKYFFRWGKHFLPSIHGAHAKQQCNSFKDPGPLQYGEHSRLFIACRDRLDYIFDTLPPPKPSITITDESGSVKEVTVSMSEYRNENGNCFAAVCQVKLSNGSKAKASTLRKSTEVWTPNGGRKVVAIIATRVKEKEMCKIGQLLITPWHPIRYNAKWVFPDSVAESKVKYVENVGTNDEWHE